MSSVEFDALGVSIRGTSLVRDVSLKVGSGGFIGLVGPNGGGKSTILRALYRAVAADAGQVRVDGVDVSAVSLRENARRVAALTQTTSLDFDFTAGEVVATGRLPHRSATTSSRRADAAACADAMRMAGVGHLADRVFTTLSGGEAQRVMIARAFAQQPQVLVLDEPTNHLDIRHQFAVLSSARGQGVTVVAALHDLNLAAQYCDTLVVVANGSVVASGTPDEIIVAGRIGGWFGIDAHVVRHPRLDVPQILFDERQA